MEEKTFAQKLKKLRKKAGLTQEDLACITGFSVMTIRRWEWGKRTPRLEAINKIAKVFNCSETELLNGATPDRWVLHIKLADDKERDFIDMTKDMPCVSNLTVNPNGASLELSANWNTFADDSLFDDFVQQLRNSRGAILGIKKCFENSTR